MCKKLASLGTHDTGQRIEKNERAIKNGQSRETGNIGYTGQRLEKTERAIKNGQSKETGNLGYT
jgi:hypothetical protein